SNHDFKIDHTDAVSSTMQDEKGKPLTGKVLFDRYNELWPDGEVTAVQVDGWLTRWPAAGLDKHGNPIFKLVDRKSIPSDKSELGSPYDHKMLPKGVRPGGTDHEPRPGG